MQCAFCHKPFTPQRVTQMYCSRKCCKAAYYNREWTRDEYPSPKAIRYFNCQWCGRGVNVYDTSDPRQKFCSGKCYLRAKEHRKAIRRRKLRADNLGMSGGMSLASLIRRERRDLD